MGFLDPKTAFVFVFLTDKSKITQIMARQRNRKNILGKDSSVPLMPILDFLKETHTRAKSEAGSGKAIRRGGVCCGKQTGFELAFVLPKSETARRL